MRRKRATPLDVRKLQGQGKRCNSRHPNWRGIRCEREAGMFHDHRAHRGEDYEWVDARTAV